MADAAKASSCKKAKDALQRLSELRRGLIHYTDAQYGTANEPLFVMRTIVDGIIQIGAELCSMYEQDFQGVGPSKKRAKLMASDRALVHLGASDASVLQFPPPETPHVDDSTADVFTGLLYSNFESPNDSATDADLKLPFYEPESPFVYEESEYDTYTTQDAFQGYIGRNAVSIMSEMRPDAMYEIVYQSDSTPSRFVTGVRVKGRSYCGDARSKRISKGRAAAVALTDIYGIRFGTAEDGMPVYEGSTKVWENYKTRLEMEAELQTAPVNAVNPVERLNETFPEAEFEFLKSEGDGFFRAKFTVAGTAYEGIGTNKRDAKANAAANAVEGLGKSGEMGRRLAKKEAKRKQRDEKEKKRQSENGDAASAAGQKEKPEYPSQAPNPPTRLQDIYPQAVFQILGETPLRNTPMKAFVTAVKVGEQSFVGVGRSKKVSRSAAAEKALRSLGNWTEEDEAAKRSRQKADRTIAPPLMEIDDFGALAPDNEMLQRGRHPKGRGRWKPEGGRSRGYGPRGRGRGHASVSDWFGSGMDDIFSGDAEGLDMMVGELSQLVGRILETNPTMGVTDVWNLLQHNPEYQSWRSGALASNMQSRYAESFGAGYYGPPAGAAGYEYNYQPYLMGGSDAGKLTRSWSRDTGTRIQRGGQSRFPRSGSYW